MNTPVFHTPWHLSLTHDCSCDFTLPEYMPPIRRVLSVEAAPLPESRFLSGGALQLGGTLAITLTYLGEDDTLTAADLTDEYTAATAAPEGIDPAAVGVDTSVENVSCRVTAPRALTVRTRLRTRLTNLTPRAIEEKLTDAAGARLGSPYTDSIERLSRTAGDTCLHRGEITATASGTLKMPAETKIIHPRAAVRIESAIAGIGGVSVQGDVQLHILTLTPDGRYETVTVKTPLSETVPIPDAAEGDAARAWGRAAAITIRPGEEGFSWEAEYDLEAEAARTAEPAYTADAYCTRAPATVTMEETDSLSLLRCGVNALTLTGEGSRKSPAAAGEQVIDVSAVAVPDHVECRDGVLAVHGSCAFSVLIAVEGAPQAEEFTLPFRCEMPAAAAAEDVIWRCSPNVITAAARVDGDKLAVTAELCLSTLALSRNKIRCAGEITVDKSAPYPARDGMLRICYPDPGQPLWEIAKHYAVPRASLGDAELADGEAMVV